MTSREFASWPDLQTAQRHTRILQNKYQAAAVALDRADQALTRIAARHTDNGFGACTTCYGFQNIPLRWPCPTYLDATGQSDD